jgi:glycerophosphoryl diester phosphodiesterase
MLLALLAGLGCSKLGAQEHADSSNLRSAASPSDEVAPAGRPPAPATGASAAPPLASATGSADPAGADVIGRTRRFPKEFQVTAMRGVAPRGPSNGNTIQSFRAAHEKGVRYVEVDLFMTRDGALVSAHEPAVEGCGIIPNMAAETLLNCAMPHGFRVASLSQILSIPFAGIFLDLKETKQAEAAPRVVQAAAQAVVAAKREQDVVLMTYNAPEAVVRIVRENGLRAGMKGYPSSPADTEQLVRQAAAAGFEMICVKAKYVTPELIRKSAELGVWHLPWSIAAHTLPHWQALAQAGAGGLIVLHYELVRKEVAPHWTPLSQPTAGAPPASN